MRSDQIEAAWNPAGDGAGCLGATSGRGFPELRGWKLGSGIGRGTDQPRRPQLACADLTRGGWVIETTRILTEATPWLHQYGYVALATAVLFEGVGIPLPGVILMSGAALLAGQGELSLPAVWLTAWLAAMSGDNLGYWIGRSGGRRLMPRIGVSQKRLGCFEGCFRRFGVWLILFGRFFDGTRQLDGLIAGSARMPWPKFFIADLAGAAAWVSVWVIGLYTLDRHTASLHRLLGYINPWVAGAVFILLGTVLYRLFRRRTCDDEALEANATTGRERVYRN
jgi:membrane protein DedA with SNARE-associated domain